jgi:hypothetical protein
MIAIRCRVPWALDCPSRVRRVKAEPHAVHFASLDPLSQDQARGSTPIETTGENQGTQSCTRGREPRYCGLALPCCRRGCVVRAAAMASTVSSRPSATLMTRS